MLVAVTTAGGDWRVAAMVTWCDVAWLATVRETGDDGLLIFSN